MNDWDIINLGEVIKINALSIPKKYKYSRINYYDISSVKSGYIESIKTIDLDDAPSRAQRIVKSGDTIISTVRPSNRAFYYFKEAKENDVISTGFAVLTPNVEKIDKRYLYYLVTNKDFTDYLVANEQGATYPSVNPDIFLKAKVKLPLLPIQKKIAAILSAYDDLIENNLKQIRLLEEMAQITYQEWFVRLKFPNHENTPIDETTGLPIGWHFGKVIDLIELQRGFDLPIQDREHGSIPIIASTGTVGFHSSYKVQGAGVVTGRSGTIGQVMFVDSDFFPLNTTLWVKSYKSCKPIFVKHLLDSLNLESLCGGAAVPSLDRKAVHVQKAVIPPAKLMNDFDVYAASHYEAMKVLRSQNQLLKEARDILLPRLMTGKITVE